MPNPSHVIQFITESDKMLIPEFHQYIAYLYVARSVNAKCKSVNVYTNTGLKSTTKQDN